MNRKTSSIPARKRAAVALLVPFLDPLRWAKRAVGLGEELARLVVLSLLGGALVELIVARVAVTGLVGGREARIVRRRSDLCARANALAHEAHVVASSRWVPNGRRELTF